MSLDYLIPVYYSDEWDKQFNDGVRNVLNKCYLEAFPHTTEDIRDVIQYDHFHDWTITSICIYQNDSTCVEIQLTHNKGSCKVLFYNVSFFKFDGSISIETMEFPKTNNMPAIAQIMDVWISYNGIVEYIILLNDCRFIKIRTNDVKVERT